MSVKHDDDTGTTQLLYDPQPIAALREANIARDKEFNPDKVITLSFRGNELAGEVGEACNIIKKMERTRLGLYGGLPYGLARDMLKDELADAIMCIDLIAMDLQIDLGTEVRRKFNKDSISFGFNTRMR